MCVCVRVVFNDVTKSIEAPNDLIQRMWNVVCLAQSIKQRVMCRIRQCG